jgi:hypothetical protein
MEDGEGTGYKVVRKVSVTGLTYHDGYNFPQYIPNTYEPFWTHFYKNGAGGAMGGGNSQRSGNKLKVKCRYIINRPSRVTHKRMAHAHTELSLSHYRAGIHLYKTLESALEFLRVGAGAKYVWKNNLVIIECDYRKAIAADNKTIVAMEITPRKEVDTDATVQRTESVHSG